MGEDTLATGSLSGELIDDGAVTSLDLSVTMVAASEDDEDAYASADTFANVEDGSEVLFSSTVNKESSTQDATGSTATATSTTDLSAYDIDTEFSPAGSSDDDDSSGEDGTSGEDEQPEWNPTPADVESDASVEAGGNLDGSFAALDFNLLAEGDNTFVSVDAYALAIEDELSLAEGFVVLAVD
jgi:hypothetical protein